ncbi:putative lipase atg15 [Golovinomyces cichoracearum]|uniref:triacylglycerol lipase n=1 Tax=Golovinomyces cichoracearum TaxID=62708 RepID=A0A420J203_9PEZI|nr:putative lipase atg15 [Golovinomyces cichoracearum]
MTVEKDLSVGKIMAQVFLLLALTACTSSIQAPFQQAMQPNSPLLLSASPSGPPVFDSSLFKLRHVFHHGDLNQPGLHKRYDVIEPENAVWIESDAGTRVQHIRNLRTRNRPIKIHRLKDRRPTVIDSLLEFSRNYPQIWTTSQDEWSLETVLAPDLTDVDTILTLAQMSANAYLEHNDSKDWSNVREGFNWSNPTGFGWNGDGLKGYLYADDNNSTVIIAVKGTSFALWSKENTAKNDKLNDNLFFSCCCGQQGNAFYQEVCSCATSRYTCNLTCLKDSMMKENRYYTAGRHLYKNVTELYPNSSIWLTGHSLGGSISSMIGLTYGAPVVTFEAVPEALPVNRLGIPSPPGTDPDRPGQRDYTGAFHFGHTADPIFMGTCNGLMASCSYAGFALESACHTGYECVWDVVTKNSTRASILTHRIHYLIDNVIKKWTEVPKCKLTSNCYDCLLWKGISSNSSETSTYPSLHKSKKTTTQTTCHTPGWFWCLDTTTDTSGVSTSSFTTSTSAPSTTCHTPGWFGCNDKITEADIISSTTALYNGHTTLSYLSHQITPSPDIPASGSN